tara:strand:- start:2086 stop:2760 length:675 start_codon:yes stop_codon:yes gene_type:complete
MVPDKKSFNPFIENNLLEQTVNEDCITQIETSLNWDDLMISKSTHEKIKTIEDWLELHKRNNRGHSKNINAKSGYIAFFYGPSGTGKTFTAALLGKYAHIPVYRVNLSILISKYIGETEKNLYKVLDLASKNNKILLFDKADALFGKRTEIQDAHDRYATQEISYLLENIKKYSGLVIFSSTSLKNMHPHLRKHFKIIIRFNKHSLREPSKTELKLAIKKQKIN